MRITALVALLLLSVAGFADSFTVIPLPTGSYTSATTNSGGGDGSEGIISSLGPFNFSSPMVELAVPGSWGGWNCPPATESCTPNVLWTGADDVNTVTLTFTGHQIVGFELQPNLFHSVEEVTAQFFNGAAMVGMIQLSVSGEDGAVLFAAQTDGAFTSVVITDLSGNSFAIGQLRSGNQVPEPASLVLLGSGLLGIGAVLLRKFSL